MSREKGKSTSKCSKQEQIFENVKTNKKLSKLQCLIYVSFK